MKHMNRLRNELAIADTAIAYVNALKRELENSEENNKTAAKTKKTKANYIQNIFFHL